ncbi:DUF4190 domain-containing protein [Gordonia sp. OPL2]|uniref:DUF4190 domain-containing protein n=1 Tax=Gordonia sp. OPL2 TaxID=2486274 RepID=UPI001655A080|nr:DUF4190 domain-containing protein [Gordonia sp. OPL2]
MTYPEDPHRRQPSDGEWSDVPPVDPYGSSDPVYGRSPFGQSPPNPDAPYPGQPYPNAPYPNQQYPNQQPYPNQPYPNAPYPNQQYGQAYGAAAHGGQPYAGQPFGVPGAMTPQTDGRATASLICGVLSLPLVLFCSGLAVPIPIVAVVLGVLARRDIANSGGLRTGAGMALAGIITGAVALVLMVIVLVFLGFSVAADLAHA